MTWHASLPSRSPTLLTRALLAAESARGVLRKTISKHNHSPFTYVVALGDVVVNYVIVCRCVPCPKNHYIDAQSKQCEACPQGTVLPSSSSSWGVESCRACGEGLHRSRDGDACVTSCKYTDPNSGHQFDFTNLPQYVPSLPITRYIIAFITSIPVTSCSMGSVITVH